MIKPRTPVGRGTRAPATGHSDRRSKRPSTPRFAHYSCSRERGNLTQNENQRLSGRAESEREARGKRETEKDEKKKGMKEKLLSVRSLS